MIKLSFLSIILFNFILNSSSRIIQPMPPNSIKLSTTHRIHSPSPSLPIASPIILNTIGIITSITYIIDICDSKAPTDITNIQDLWFTNDISLQGMFQSYSYGKDLFLKENNIIIERIQMPCTGTYMGQIWNSELCGENEIYGWADLATQFAQKQGININKFNHHILLLPPRQACAWSGLSQQTCQSGQICITWINDNVVALDTIMHELGHSLGLHHSGTCDYNMPNYFNQYGDQTSPMGNSNNIKAFNAPQSWSLYWSQPINTITSNNMLPGKIYYFTLPALITSPINFIVIRPDWIQNPSPIFCNNINLIGTAPVSYYISYRMAINYDIGLSINNSIIVYAYNGSQILNDRPLTILIDQLNVGEMWIDSKWANIIVTFKSYTSTFATIGLCRFINSIKECKIN